MRQEEIANHVLRFFRGNEGYSGGSFSEALLTAFSKADMDNQSALGQGFPIHAHLFWLATTHPGGLDEIRKIASQVTA